jgi:hypothetical protein
VKWIGLIAVLAIVALGVYSFNSRRENLACQRSAPQLQSGPSCHKYTYWWNR